VREKATSRFEDELFAFIHGFGLHPGHGRLLAEGHITGRDCYPSALIEVLPIRVECTQRALTSACSWHRRSMTNLTRYRILCLCS
jgi:hypothetical protein